MTIGQLIVCALVAAAWHFVGRAESGRCSWYTFASAVAIALVLGRMQRPALAAAVIGAALVPTAIRLHRLWGRQELPSTPAVRGYDSLTRRPSMVEKFGQNSFPGG